MNSFKFQETVHRSFEAGTMYRASEVNFPALKGLAVQGLVLHKGAVREPHTHPNAHQLDYCISGHAQVGIVAPGGERQLLELKAGDISFVPQGHLHWIQNLGTENLHFLVVLSHEEPETLELSEMLAKVPHETLKRAFGLDESLLGSLPTKTVLIGGQ